MDFSFRGPPRFWRRIAEMAEAAEQGETVYWGVFATEDPYATSDLRITFIGDPEGDGIGALYIPDDDHAQQNTAPWNEISERVATDNMLGLP